MKLMKVSLSNTVQEEYYGRKLRWQ